MLKYGLLFALFAVPSLTGPPAIARSPIPIEVVREEQLQQQFQELGVEGSILIYDAQTARTYQHNRDRNTTPFLPASTFKILNALIALETVVMPNDVAVLVAYEDLRIRNLARNHCQSKSIDVS